MSEEARQPEEAGAGPAGGPAAPGPEPVVDPLHGPPQDVPFQQGDEGERPRRFASKFKRGLVSVAAATYDARADDLEERAVRAMRTALNEEAERILGVATRTYDARADDLEERAVRAIQKVLEEETERMLAVATETYDRRADDLEERAVRALRKAIIEETRRIRATIERSVSAKRREVRLSLLVLVAANLLYLFVYWLTT